jgi:hypothetical protein
VLTGHLTMAMRRTSETGQWPAPVVSAANAGKQS